MMNYLITENQYNNLNEISRSRGRYDANPLEDFFYEIESFKGFKKKDFISVFKKFFTKIGQEIDNLEDSQILLYFEELPRYTRGGSVLKGFFYKKEVLASFAYYIVKKHFNLIEGAGGIEYLVFESNSRAYFFFDPNFKIFVGGVGLDPEKRFKGKCYSVSISAVERELIGGGYGLKMYLTIINDVDYLISSTVLYAGSLRMWKDVLPKYVNVWVEFDYKSDPELVIPGKRYKLDNVQDFIASSNHNKLKSK